MCSAVFVVVDACILFVKSTLHLPFNFKKCAILHFFSSSALLTPDYYLNSILLSSINHHKDLGVIFSADLSWTRHYMHITTLAYKLLSLLRRSFSSSNSVATKKLLYTALIRSRISYASSVWYPHLIKDTQLLEKYNEEPLNSS